METWTTRDLPVLRALVSIFESGGRGGLGVRVHALAVAADMPETEVGNALRALNTASPPYFRGTSMSGLDHPAIITSITERALRAVGQWPASDNAADAIIAAFNEAAEAEPDEEKRSALRRTGTFLAGAGREVLYRVVTGVASGEISEHIPPHI
jgi:hypothetical protein